MQLCTLHPTKLVLVLVLTSACCPGLASAWSIPSWADTVVERGIALVWRPSATPSARPTHYRLSAATMVVNSSVTIATLREMNAGVDLGDDGTYALDAGMALNVPGYPAIPPMPTTVAATNTQHMLMYAAAYHLTLVEFAASNPQVNVMDFDKLTTLRVPSVPSNTHLLPCPSGCHCVRPGETLADVAKLVGSTSSAIMATNPHILRQGGRLFVGQALLLPQNTPTHVLPRSITVRAWQSPYAAMLQCPGLPLTSSYLPALAKANNVSLDKLVRISAEVRRMSVGTLDGLPVAGGVEVGGGEAEGDAAYTEEKDEQGKEVVGDDDEEGGEEDEEDEEDEEEDTEEDDEQEDTEEDAATGTVRAAMMEDLMHAHDDASMMMMMRKMSEEEGPVGAADDAAQGTIVEDEEDEEEADEQEDSDDDDVRLGFDEYPSSAPSIPQPNKGAPPVASARPAPRILAPRAYSGRRLVTVGKSADKEAALPMMGEAGVAIPAKTTSDPSLDQPLASDDTDHHPGEAHHASNAVGGLLHWALSTAQSMMHLDTKEEPADEHGEEYDAYFTGSNEEEEGDESEQEMEEPWLPHGQDPHADSSAEEAHDRFFAAAGASVPASEAREGVEGCGTQGGGGVPCSIGMDAFFWGGHDGGEGEEKEDDMEDDEVDEDEVEEDEVEGGEMQGDNVEEDEDVEGDEDEEDEDEVVQLGPHETIMGAPSQRVAEEHASMLVFPEDEEDDDDDDEEEEQNDGGHIL